MLEEPSLPRQQLLDTLHAAYALQPEALTFLPLGADVNTAVYRVTTATGDYFLKLRQGAFDEMSVALPAYLHRRGLSQVIPPLPAASGDLWARLAPYHLILYPFIEGVDAYTRELSDEQWVELGAALKRLHDSELPLALLHQLPLESYDPHGRSLVRRFQDQVQTESFAEPYAAACAQLMRQQADRISQLVSRAERLASELQSRQPELVLCHSDLHAGNLHLAPSGALYIVDWDNPVLAPPERDLMHIGATPRWGTRRIKSLFYRGYGPAQVDGMALAYYRCERIIQDIAEFCQQLLLTTDGGDDRPQSLRYFSSQFEPGQEVDIALRSPGKQTLSFFG